MQLVDYTHPYKVPSLRLKIDRRSPNWYLRLNELSKEHPFNSYVWALFRYPEWLEGGSAWLQAKDISEDLLELARELGLTEELRPVVGSDDSDYDEALAQGLKTFGLRPLVAEITLKKSISN
jgi:hypothetical protein